MNTTTQFPVIVNRLTGQIAELINKTRYYWYIRDAFGFMRWLPKDEWKLK